MSRLNKIKESVKSFYERHDIMFDTVGGIALSAIVSYGLGIAFLVICKKLGLTDK